MQKALHSIYRKRLVAVVALLCAMVVPAGAQEDAYYAFNVHVEAYPAGKGEFYATSNVVTALRGLEEYEIPEWNSQMDLKYVSDWTGIGAWVKPAEGYLYAGYRTSKVAFDDDFNYIVARDNKGNVIYGDHKEPNTWVWGLVSDRTQYDGEYNVIQSKEVMDSLNVLTMIPNEPNNYVQLLFTRVRCKVADGQSGLGSASMIEKNVVNEIGQGVYAVATPYGESTFEGWYVNGVQVDTNPYIGFIVRGTTMLEARFTHPLARTIKFPEGGGYVEWYSDYDYDIPTTVSVYHPTLAKTKLTDTRVGGSNWQTTLDLSSAKDSIRGRIPALIYGMGECTLYPKSENPAAYPSGSYLLQYSGDFSMPLTSGLYYYLLNKEGTKLVRTTQDIPEKRVYAELSADMFKHDVPDTILLYNGIGDVNGDQIVDVGDIMAVINYMAGQRAGISQTFADVNGDGTVDVGDIMAIINIMARQ